MPTRLNALSPRVFESSADGTSNLIRVWNTLQADIPRSSMAAAADN